MMKPAVLIVPCLLLSGCVFVSVTKSVEPARPAAPSEVKGGSGAAPIEPVVVLKSADNVDPSFPVCHPTTAREEA
jgi:hypothetical protein